MEKFNLLQKLYSFSTSINYKNCKFHQIFNNHLSLDNKLRFTEKLIKMKISLPKQMEPKTTSMMNC